MPSKTEIVPLEGKILKSYPQHITLNYRRPPEALSGKTPTLKRELVGD